ncbi:MAG: hypothetical protein ACJA0N_002704 [Pseudohongiellaceae bacterium]|jgi:hypothetical protein
MNKPTVLSECKKLAFEIITVYLTLMKIMVPVVVLFKGLALLGAIEWLAKLVSPIMSLVGLPDAMGLVWATTMVTNIYGGMLVFYEVAGQQALSVAQISTLGVMMLIAHSLPVEVAVAKKAGVRVRATLILRIVSALLLGALLHMYYQWSGQMQQASTLLWRPELVDTSLLQWGLEQLKTFAMIFVVIAALMSLLRLLKWLGIERLMHALMTPLLRLLNISNSASNTTIIGVTLGLSFGGALLINEAKSGRLSQRDIFIALGFLALCHSLIEDTLLIMLLGADIYVVLWVRLFFSLIVLTVLARVMYRYDGHKMQRWCMTPSSAIKVVKLKTP